MNILITGAGGFIGRKLSSHLMTLGHQVSGLSLKGPSHDLPGFKDYYQQDLSRPFSLNGRFDIVVHLAAYNITNVGTKDAGLYTAINVDGTRHLLQAVHAQKFIYLSTAKVYKNEGLPILEDSPLAPQGAYEQSKLKAEDVCRVFFNKGPLVILRSVNVMGWGQSPKAVLPVFFQKAKANQALDIISAAHTLMQFVYVGDLINAIEALIHHEGPGGVFNIAHEETISLGQLAREIIRMTQSSSVLNVPMDTPEVLFSPVNCDKAYRHLGWKAQTGLTKILELYKEEHARDR